MNKNNNKKYNLFLCLNQEINKHMSNCTALILNTVWEEPPVPTFFTMLWAISIWALIHIYLSFRVSDYFTKYFPINVGNPNYYTYIFCRSFTVFGFWEILEYALFWLLPDNNTLFGRWYWMESVNKKIFDMCQNSIGIFIFIGAVKTANPVEWNKTNIFKKIPEALLIVVQFYAAAFVQFSYVRNICYPYKNVTLEEFKMFPFNNIPFGFYIYIVVAIILIYLGSRISTYFFPYNSIYIKKIRFLEYVYFLFVMIPNIFWLWSTYVNSWISAFFVFFFYYLGRDSFQEMIEYLYMEKNEQKRDMENYEGIGTVDFVLIPNNYAGDLYGP